MNIMKYKVLSELRPSEKGQIQRFTNDRIASKMTMMGIFPGTTLELVRHAPFKGGYYIKVNKNTALALRKSEAECILLQA